MCVGGGYSYIIVIILGYTKLHKESANYLYLWLVSIAQWFSSHESEHDFRDTVKKAVGKLLAAAVGTFSSNMPLPI